MKIIIMSLSILISVSINGAYAGFDDILKDVFLETPPPVGSHDYVFHPGEQIIEKRLYSVYYSGYEGSPTSPTLLFTVFEGNKSYLVKFPSPDIIHIKDVRMQVRSFDNTEIRIPLIRAQPAKTGQTYP